MDVIATIPFTGITRTSKRLKYNIITTTCRHILSSSLKESTDDEFHSFVKFSDDRRRREHKRRWKILK